MNKDEFENFLISLMMCTLLILSAWKLYDIAMFVVHHIRIV